MPLGEADGARLSPPLAPPLAPPLVTGLSDDERARPAREYFASFRWEPPVVDPAWLPASQFLAWLDDVAAEDSGTRAR